MSQALVDEPSNGAAHSWSFEAEKSALCGLWCSDNREFKILDIRDPGPQSPKLQDLYFYRFSGQRNKSVHVTV